MLRFLRKNHEGLIDVGVLLCIEVFLISTFRPDLLFLSTTTAGGDTPSFTHPAEYLRSVLFPAGRPFGWDPGNFAGYPPFQYYNIAPFTLIAFLSEIIPFEVAFKLVTSLGNFLLPISVYLMFRLMRYSHPLPAIAACATLAFQFNPGNSMWGGNILSNLAGEFCFTIGLSLSIAFWGTLWRGVEDRKWVSINAILLGLTGLSHPIAFLYATLGGTFLIFQRGFVLKNLDYLVRVYAGGALLMSFWLIPLIAKLEFSTKINWSWETLPFFDLFPVMLIPFLVIAILNAVLGIFPSFRDRRSTFLLYGIFIHVIAFFNSTWVGLPEIRFIPMVQLTVIFLAVDSLRHLKKELKFKSLLAIAMVPVILLWITKDPLKIPSWVDWNYSGIEKKPAWKDFRDINEFIKGNQSNPRVYYEHNNRHNRFGSSRAFESIPYFSGRSTLEGVLLQNALNSPFIYYIQSELSTQPTNVIPGYIYSRLNLDGGREHLKLYNVSHFIAVSKQIKNGLDTDSEYSLEFNRGTYSIYRLNSNLDRYVTVPKFSPVMFKVRNWKQDFHNWFRQINLLDTPILRASDIRNEDQEKFSGPVDTLLDLPKTPLNVQCNVKEVLSLNLIEFTTDCVGVPHIIRMSYFPNWKAEGAQTIYLVSPAFMLVIPDQPKVSIRYGQTMSNYMGFLFTGIGTVGLGWGVLRRRFLGREHDLDSLLFSRFPSIRPFIEKGIVCLGIGLIVLITGTGIWNYFGQGTSQRIYDRGWEQFDDKKYTEARKFFNQIRNMEQFDPLKVHATFWAAQTYFREENFSKALKVFQELVQLYPENPWGSETRYLIGLCLERLNRIEDARLSYEGVLTFGGNKRWIKFSKDRLEALSILEGKLLSR